MKYQRIISSCALLTLVACVGARNARSTSPENYNYTSSEGQQMACTHEAGTTTTSTGHPVLGTLAGGAVGGLIGNQFGRGGGKTAATVVGAVGGAVVGNRMSQGSTEQTPGQEVCQPVN